jgi:hypothetical protein
MPKNKLFKRDTEENRIEDVRRDYKVIRYMDNPSLDIIKEAVIRGGHRAIEYIGADNMTPDLYQIIVERFPSSFGSLPNEVRTPELCEKAVSLSGTNLRYVTNKTQELCCTAMRQTSNSYQYIPVEFRNEEINYLAVKNGTVLLSDIPQNKRSKRMCLSAVKRQSNYIEHVPERHKIPEFYLEVFEHNHNIFKLMPKDLMTEDICLKALRNSPEFLDFIPKEKQTDKICLDFLSNPYNQRYTKYILSDSPAVKKKIERINNRDKKYKQMFGRHGHGGGFYDAWGMPPMMEMIVDPVFDYVYDCEDKIEDLTDTVETLKKELDELKKLIPRPTESHEG